MNSVLSSKSSFTCQDVSQVWRSIEDHVTRDEAEAAVAAAVDETELMIVSLADGNPGRCVYGWSGGKDSIALQIIMERVGVSACVLGVIPHLEWHSYINWVEHHHPDGLRIIPNRKLTVDWLATPAAARYLFPATSQLGYFWTLQSARQAQLAYQKSTRPRLQIFGRRSQDGNVCGDEHGVLRTKDMVAYCPIRDWTHEMVLAAIHYHQRSLPPVYDQPNGWTAGTGSWPGRRVGPHEQSWNETYLIEPGRVEEAAEADVPGARDCLARHA